MKELYAFISKTLRIKEKAADPSGFLIENINSALSDVFSARNNFNMAVGSDDIELAIYRLSTAEIKYRNLLREAKRLGIIRRDLPALPVEGEEEN